MFILLHTYDNGERWPEDRIFFEGRVVCENNKVLTFETASEALSYAREQFQKHRSYSNEYEMLIDNGTIVAFHHTSGYNAQMFRIVELK